LLTKVDQRTADQVGDAVIELLQPLADRLHILTADNGKEFADIERIFSHLPAEFFFRIPMPPGKEGKTKT